MRIEKENMRTQVEYFRTEKEILRTKAKFWWPNLTELNDQEQKWDRDLWKWLAVLRSHFVSIKVFLKRGQKLIFKNNDLILYHLSKGICVSESVLNCKAKNAKLVCAPACWVGKIFVFVHYKFFSLNDVLLFKADEDVDGGFLPKL